MGPRTKRTRACKTGKIPMLTTYHQNLANQVSPLMLADRMLTLAKEADTAGYIGAADRLVQLAFQVWDQEPLARA